MIENINSVSNKSFNLPLQNKIYKSRCSKNTTRFSSTKIILLLKLSQEKNQ